MNRKKKTAYRRAFNYPGMRPTRLGNRLKDKDSDRVAGYDKLSTKPDNLYGQIALFNLFLLESDLGYGTHPDIFHGLPELADLFSSRFQTSRMLNANHRIFETGCLFVLVVAH